MLDQFFRETNIHGLRYLAYGNRTSFRFLWLLFIVTSFAVAGYIIFRNVVDWENSPVVVTSVDESLIRDKFPFPMVTLCPTLRNEDTFVREFYRANPQDAEGQLQELNKYALTEHFTALYVSRRRTLNTLSWQSGSEKVLECLERNVSTISVLNEGCGFVRLLAALKKLRTWTMNAHVIDDYISAVYNNETVPSNQDFLATLSAKLGVSEDVILNYQPDLSSYFIRETTNAYQNFFPAAEQISVQEDSPEYVYLDLQPLSEFSIDLETIQVGNFTASEILRDAMLFWKSEGLPSSFSDALGLTYDRAVASSPELVAEIRAHMTGFPDTTNDFGYVMELMSHNHNENWFTDKSVNKFRGASVGLQFAIDCFESVESVRFKKIGDDAMCANNTKTPDCEYYCEVVSFVRENEDIFVQAFEMSVEKASSDLDFLELPWCRRGPGEATRDCWDEIITDKGFCYASKDTGRLVQELGAPGEDAFLVYSGVPYNQQNKRSRKYDVFVTPPGRYVQGLFDTNVTISYETETQVDVRIEVRIVKAIKTTTDFAQLSMAKRQCYYPHERKLEHFPTYSQGNCALECTWDLARRECGCVPWYLKGTFPEEKACLYFGTSCFNTKLENRHFETNTDCLDKCLRDCDSTWYSMTAQEVHPKTSDIPESEYFDKNFECGNPAESSFSNGFTFRPDAETKESKDTAFTCQYAKQLLSTSNTSARYNFPQNILSQISKFGMRFSLLRISVKSPTVELVVKTASTTIIGMISNVGGTLGLFCGMSVLSILEAFHWLMFNQNNDGCSTTVKKKKKTQAPISG